MFFFNNIYISSYRAYKGKNANPKISSMVFVFICLEGILSLLFELSAKFWNIDLHPIGNFLGKNFLLLILLSAAVMFLIYSYYSDEKIEALITRFEQKTYFERNLWGWISVFTLIAKSVTFAILLSNSNN